MRSTACLAVICAMLLLCSASYAIELAKVADYSITSDEYLDNFAALASTKTAPARTPEGKREFLDRLIAKHLLSQFFHSIGWDTMSVWDSLAVDYAKGQYIQALYFDAIPEVRNPSSKVSPARLMELSRQYVDSLQKAYDLKVDEKAIILLAERSGTRRMDKTKKDESDVVWLQLVTSDEKQKPAATFLDGRLTIGEIVKNIDDMPSFARPTPGNSDEIAVTIEHFGREAIFKSEFDKRKLRGHPWFIQKMTNKREELMLGRAFVNLRDTCTVTEEEVKKYYEEHRDDYMTVMRISLATMKFDSEDIAKKAAERVGDGEDFRAVAIDLSVYSASETGYDTTGFIDRSQNTALYDALWDKEIGAVAGPVSEAGIWYVGKLLDRENPRLLGLEEAAPMIAKKMRLLKADQALAKLIERLRANTKIVIDEKALAALELPE